VLTGSNGAGKSTALALLASQHLVPAGSIMALGNHACTACAETCRSTWCRLAEIHIPATCCVTNIFLEKAFAHDKWAVLTRPSHIFLNMTSTAYFHIFECDIVL
jgi:ABC-type transport system involved in cytochrome bd biosynthesis fused ATPase/permease subunit